MIINLNESAQELRRTAAFFFEHAGYSFNPKTETADEGRKRCAIELARAEAYAKDQQWEFEWTDDWSVGSHVEFFGKGSIYHDEQREPQTCESCVLRNQAGGVLGSLGCIDDASDDYRRVIEAELASEALATIQAEERREAEVDRFVAQSYAL